METFKIKIAASNKVFYDGEAQSLTVPYIDGGTVTFLSHHCNAVVPIDAGEMRLKTAQGEVKEAFVSDGFLEFLSNEATMVCVSVELPEEIDKRRAEEALERAEEELRQKMSQYDYYITKANLSRAMERIKVKNRHQV
ncbi:MAG TPA: F0F1 ATP synthase subunit epsilon [Candidatus Eubacterium faecipullorum]|uniref:ATP synthase epsilon chain n=1 Tax=Candidatus Eubacterium faecipullorum TaxID=2838571 RepID=A0A9D1UFA6_9FIRM|nr:F0F1 ATP synthase subunit epsilon [Candidatus Eubacterium faecipullorum]